MTIAVMTSPVAAPAKPAGLSATTKGMLFGMIAVLLVMRRWGEYAFIRPGREMLWSSLDTESKYKAKSFIDLPVYRAADSIGAQAKIALDASGSSPASVALVGAGLAVLWVLNGAWLGRQYRRQESSP